MVNKTTYPRVLFMLVIYLLVNVHGSHAQTTIKSSHLSAFEMACGTPSGLSTNNITTTSVILNWSAVPGAVNYTVQYRKSGQVSWTSISANNTSKTISALISGAVYEFRVKSNCSYGVGMYSAKHVCSTQAISCSVPDVNLFSSTNISASSCTVSWVAVSGAVNYSVQYRIRNSGASWSSVTTATNSTTLTSLTPLTLYEFQVSTNCNTGSSAYSSPGIFTTIANPCTVVDVNYFSSTNITAGSCTVGWAAVTGATSYNVQYRIRNSGGSWTTTNATTNSHNLTGLSATTLYEFQVQTVCNGGTSVYSSPGIFTTASGASCGIPSGLNVSGLNASGATLSWVAVSGAGSYSIQYRTTGSSSWTSTTSTTASKTLSGLNANTEYEFQVQSICGSASSAYSTLSNFTTTAISGSALPVPDHIVICILENHAYEQIIGNSAAPHINALANDVMSANFTESYGLTHPSQPNYLLFFSGSNQGVTDNTKPGSHFTSMNLGAALQNAGRTFVTYSEGLPSVGYDGEASGEYVRRHNPVANWMGNGTNQLSTATNQPFTAFPGNYANLPTVSYVVPNLTNGMHDGTGNTAISAGDNWFNTYMMPYVQWARTHNSLFILTFDEDDNLHSNHIPTIFSGQMVVQGQYATGINHFNVLRTIEDMYGLTHSGAAASNSPIHGCWTTGFRNGIVNSESNIEKNWSIYPNPVLQQASIAYDLDNSSTVEYKIFGLTGNQIYSESFGTQSEGHYEFNLPLSELKLANGIYFVEMHINNQRSVRRFVKSQD